MKLKFVKNKKKYWDFIRDLRNDPEVKKGFIQQEEIPLENHKKFMAKYGDLFYLCLCDDVPAGYVGVINKDIRVATHPDFQGKGVGKFMINQVMLKFPEAYAKVKIQNEASLNLFKACGFKEKYFILEKE